LDQVEYVKCSTSLPVLQEFFIDSAFQCSQTEQRSWVRGPPARILQYTAQFQEVAHDREWAQLFLPPARILQYTAQFQEVAHDREWAQLFLPPARILQYTAQFRHLLHQQTVKGGFRTRSYRCGHMQQIRNLAVPLVCQTGEDVGKPCLNRLSEIDSDMLQCAGRVAIVDDVRRSERLWIHWQESELCLGCAVALPPTKWHNWPVI
jgi:hypothetical protein